MSGALSLPPPPRNVRFTRRARGWLTAVVLILVAPPAALAVAGLAERAALRRLLAEGRRAEARVVEVRSYATGSSANCYVDYELSVGSASWRRSGFVTPEVLARTRVGDRVPVTYLAADPGVSRLGVVDEARVVRESRSWFLGAGALGLGLAPGLLVVVWWLLGRRALLRDGVETVETGPGTTNVILHDLRRTGRSAPLAAIERTARLVNGPRSPDGSTPPPESAPGSGSGPTRASSGSS